MKIPETSSCPGLSTALLFRLIFSFSTSSMYPVMLSMTLFPAFWLLTYILQSSAYRQNLCPRLSSSLSSSSSIIFASSGLNGPPCGVPSSFFTLTPFSMMPDSRYFRISPSTLLSLTFLATSDINLSWLTLSKNFSRSMSTVHWYPCSMYPLAAMIAWCALFPGRNP